MVIEPEIYILSQYLPSISQEFQSLVDEAEKAGDERSARELFTSAQLDTIVTRAIEKTFDAVIERYGSVAMAMHDLRRVVDMCVATAGVLSWLSHDEMGYVVATLKVRAIAEKALARLNDSAMRETVKEDSQ